jgi:hypothetical protein
MSDTNFGFPLGMYPDPENPVQSRYWDGTTWGSPVSLAPTNDSRKDFVSPLLRANQNLPQERLTAPCLIPLVVINSCVAVVGFVG